MQRLPWWLGGKESACKARDVGLILGLEKIPWRSKGQPTPVFLPGKSHGWRSLVGCSQPVASVEESDAT